MIPIQLNRSSDLRPFLFTQRFRYVSNGQHAHIIEDELCRNDIIRPVSRLSYALLLFFDTVRSFPTIVMALAVVALTGPSLGMVLVIVIITSIPGYGRLARTSTLALRNADFITAEQSLGAGPVRVLAGHILPNVIGPLLILAAMDVPVVVTIEAGLSFLGLGVLPPTPSWGSILNEGYMVIRDTPWPVIAGGIPLVLTTLGFTFLGEALRDVFDPRLRKGY